MLPLLECHKFNMVADFENPHHKFLVLKVKSVLLLENSFWVKQILQWPTSKYPKSKQFSSLAKFCLLSKCPVEITEIKNGGFGMTLFFAYMISMFFLHNCEPVFLFRMTKSNNWCYVIEPLHYFNAEMTLSKCPLVSKRN